MTATKTAGSRTARVDGYDDRVDCLMRYFVAVAALCAGVACKAPKSKICRDTCAREAECVGAKTSEEDTNFDEGECVAACAALEADQETRKLVGNHAECVAHALSCNAVRECD